MERSLGQDIPSMEGENFGLRKIDDPPYETYKNLHNRVGEPYGWGTRARINDEKAMTQLLRTPGVEVWEFLDKNDLIGYALLTCDPDKSVELEDFGFFPEHAGKGHGLFFLYKILERMKELGMHTVWLTTRSTNHPKVISFYKKAGFEVTEKVEIQP